MGVIMVMVSAFEVLLQKTRYINSLLLLLLLLFFYRIFYIIIIIIIT